jgi:hypothetical protein
VLFDLFTAIPMTLQPGDIAACQSADWTSRLIRWGTASLLPPADLRIGPSHLALICEWRSEMVWVESTTLCSSPCLIRRRTVRGVQAHLPAQRIADYVSAGGRVDLYRLTPINKLTIEDSRLLTRILMNHFIEPGIRYDLAGAILSGTRVFQWSRLFPGADLEHLFCSELVAALVMRLGRMNHSNPTRYNPARLLRELVRTGKYQRLRSITAIEETDRE